MIRFVIATGDKSTMKDTVANQFATETVLENVRILAIDQRATNSSSDEAKVGRTVTLEVTSVDAEKLPLPMKWAS